MSALYAAPYYGQVEPNRLTGITTGGIEGQAAAYTNAAATTAIPQLENGRFLCVIPNTNPMLPLDRIAVPPGAAPATAIPMLVFSERKQYDEREGYADFVEEAKDAVDGVIYPRLLELKPDTDVYTTNCINAAKGSLKVGSILYINDDGYLDEAPGSNRVYEFHVTKLYEMPNGQEGVKLQVHRLYAAGVGKVYGVEIDLAEIDPKTAVSYIGDADGFAPMVGSGTFDWGSWREIFAESGIKPCVLKNGVVQYYLEPKDFAEKEDGTPSDIVSGDDGDVMIEFPRVYWRFDYDEGDKHLQVRYSLKPFTGAVCPAHCLGGKVKDKIYIGAYLASDIDGVARSLSSQHPINDVTIAEMRDAAQALGEGYQQMPYYATLMLQILYLIWFANRDGQTGLGEGYTSGNFDMAKTGGTDDEGLFYGSTQGDKQVKFCGIEDFWGNLKVWIDGLYADGETNLKIADQSDFADVAKYSDFGASAVIQGYILSVHGGNETGFIVKDGQGIAGESFPDNGSIEKLSNAVFGGDYDSDDAAGPFNLELDRVEGDKDVKIGGRICYIGV